MKLNRRTFISDLGIAVVFFAAFGILQLSSPTEAVADGTGHYVVIATVEYDAKHDEAMKKIMLAHRERVLELDEGAIQFDISIDSSAPGRMYLYEVYSSKAAFQAHWRGPTIKRILKELKVKAIPYELSSTHSTKL